MKLLLGEVAKLLLGEVVKLLLGKVVACRKKVHTETCYKKLSSYLKNYRMLEIYHFVKNMRMAFGA